MFGIAFWSVARGIHQGQVREYMIISAYGLVLLFTSNQGIILVNLRLSSAWSSHNIVCGLIILPNTSRNILCSNFYSTGCKTTSDN
jgi:hypothetical protein